MKHLPVFLLACLLSAGCSRQPRYTLTLLPDNRNERALLLDSATGRTWILRSGAGTEPFWDPLRLPEK